jgi:hypothetical protein
MRQAATTALTLWIVLLLQTCRALAGPPLVTDDPETPGKHGWEVNISNVLEKTRDGVEMENPLFDINYGFRENDQFKVEFAVASVDPEDDRNHWGISDLLIGYKYRFFDEEQAGWMLSFYPQVSAPTGNRHVGIGSGSTELLMPFQLGKHYCDEKLFTYAEIGYLSVLDESELDSWKFGIAGEWKSTEKLQIEAEIGSFVFPHGGEPDDVFFNLGGKYKLGEHSALIGSAGRSFRDASTGTPEFMSFLGMQFTWGAEEEHKEESGAGKEK